MSCDICGKGACCVSFHSLDEQERYAKVIDAFEKARDMRIKVREDLDAAERDEAERLWAEEDDET